MPYCRNCGVELPEDAGFCPNCGAPVEAKVRLMPDVKETTMRYVVVGLFGAFLSVMISFFSPNLYFIPSFAASIFIIYMYRINEFKESLIVTFSVYLFADGIYRFLIGSMYIFYPSLVMFREPQIWDVLSDISSPISAFIAAYLGVRISPKRRKEPMLGPRRKEEGPGGVIYSL